MDETLLMRLRRLLTEATMLIKHRQQCQANAGGLCSTHQCGAHRHGIRVRCAAGLMMHIVKFTHRGVTRGQHLTIQFSGNDFELRRGDMLSEGVHQLPPAPETVSRMMAILG